MMPTFRTSQPVSAADIADPARPHLILVGLPGAGKTTIGRAAAEQLKRAFLDFDTEIERRKGTSIAEIFGSQGEPYFRGLEQKLTEELRTVGNMVLAPGGGWIANPGCLAMLRPPGTLVYLKVRPEVALTRLGKEAVRRPLLQRPDPIGELRRLLQAREKLYLQADHTVSTDMMTLPQAIDRIVALARG
jgi:shikimate kinase